MAFHFSWPGAGPELPPGAIGTLHGDSLRVEFDINMQMADFYNGLYVRTPDTP